jgi:hypothetical protein
MLVIVIIVVNLCKSTNCEDTLIVGDRYVVMSSGIMLRPSPNNSSLHGVWMLLVQRNHALAGTSGCGCSSCETGGEVSEVWDLVTLWLKVYAASTPPRANLTIALTMPIVRNFTLVELFIVTRRSRWVTDACTLEFDAKLALAAKLVRELDKLQYVLLQDISMISVIIVSCNLRI